MWESNSPPLTDEWLNMNIFSFINSISICMSYHTNSIYSIWVERKQKCPTFDPIKAKTWASNRVILLICLPRAFPPLSFYFSISATTPPIQFLLEIAGWTGLRDTRRNGRTSESRWLWNSEDGFRFSWSRKEPHQWFMFDYFCCNTLQSLSIYGSKWFSIVACGECDNW